MRSYCFVVELTFNNYRKDSLTYSCGTDRPSGLCYVSLSADLSQMVNLLLGSLAEFHSPAHWHSFIMHLVTNENYKKTFFIYFKRKIYYPLKWIQLIEWSNYLNMISCLCLSNKLKEFDKFLWICLWNLYFISVKN